MMNYCTYNDRRGYQTNQKPECNKTSDSRVLLKSHPLDIKRKESILHSDEMSSPIAGKF